MRLSVQIEFDKMLDLKTEKTSVSVGRSPNCDLVISHDSISRLHCQIEQINGEFFVTDTGSSNGTFINGKRLETHARTKYLPSQVLKLGRLDCEVSAANPEAETQEPTSKTSVHGNYTATTRIGRIDLGKPAVDPEIAKKAKPKGPRNPITDELQNSDVEVIESKRTYVLLFILVFIVLMWLMMPIFS